VCLPRHRKIWRGFRKIVQELFIDRRVFPDKIPHRFKEIESTTINEGKK